MREGCGCGAWIHGSRRLVREWRQAHLHDRPEQEPDKSGAEASTERAWRDDSLRPAGAHWILTRTTAASVVAGSWCRVWRGIARHNMTAAELLAVEIISRLDDELQAAFWGALERDTADCGA